MSLGSEPLLLPPPPLRLGVARVLRDSVVACCGECLRCRRLYLSSSRTSMMMMTMKMTLPEAMPTKMATSEPMTLEGFPPVSFSLLSLDATPARQRETRVRCVSTVSKNVPDGFLFVGAGGQHDFSLSLYVHHHLKLSQIRRRGKSCLYGCNAHSNEDDRTHTLPDNHPSEAFTRRRPQKVRKVDVWGIETSLRENVRADRCVKWECDSDSRKVCVHAQRHI